MFRPCGITPPPGISSHVLPSSVRPVFFLNTPPHCLKKKGVPLFTQLSRISLTQSASIGLAPGPDSPPTITQSMPVKSRPGKGPSRGSRERNFVRAPVSRSCPRRPSHFSDSMLAPSQMLGVQFSLLPRQSGPARPLGEHLKRVPGRAVHHVEYGLDETGRRRLVKQIGHGVDEYEARFLPSQGFIERGLVGGEGEPVLVLLDSHTLEPFRHSLGVAVLASGADLRAAGHRVPGSSRSTRCWKSSTWLDVLQYVLCNPSSWLDSSRIAYAI